MNTIKFSIIVPVYNTKLYLKQCLDSIIHQTFKNFEIIIIDDGSTDNSSCIIQEYSKCDNRIISIFQKNQGLSVARNKGIAIAKGEYLCFVDSDDTLALNALEAFYKIVIDSKYDIVSAQSFRINNNGTKTITTMPILSEYHLKNALNPSFAVSVCSKVFKRELFVAHDIQFPIGLLYEDHIVTTKTFFYSQNIFYIHQCFYNYHIRDNSITTSYLSTKKIDDVFKAVFQIKIFLTEKNLIEEYEVYPFLKLIKLSTSYILPLLDNKNSTNFSEYFIKKLESSQLMCKSNLNYLYENYFGLYFDFLTHILRLKTIDKDSKEQLVKIFDKQHMNTLSAVVSNGEFTLKNILPNYLKKHKIKRILIYGGGKIFQELEPYILNLNIKIKGIIDKNYTLLDENIKNKYPEIKQINHNSIPIIVTSIAFADEIKLLLKDKDNIVITVKELLNDI
jgi:glycosyltransferase involved in cell wall biosynthesis